MNALREYHDKGGSILLDDFVDATFTWDKHKPHKHPWVGIFHHPAEIKSPLKSDQAQRLRQLLRNKFFMASKPYLKGAVAMSPCAAEWCERELGVPTLCVRHPTDVNVQRWTGEGIYSDVLWQVGFFLRDTQFIYLLRNHFIKVRSLPYEHWMSVRDRELKKLHEEKSLPPIPVFELPPVSNEVYDTMLSQAIPCMYAHGASANNVVIECMARNAPLVVNRNKAIEYYLGQDYPLFYDTPEEAEALLVAYRSITKAASRYLACQDKTWMDPHVFAKEVFDFAESL